MSKKLIITKEKHERILIGQTKRCEIIFCRFCQKEVLWLSTKDSAEFFKISELNIFRQAENGSFHFRETEKGILLICTESINCGGQDSFTKNITRTYSELGDYGNLFLAENSEYVEK